MPNARAVNPHFRGVPSDARKGLLTLRVGRIRIYPPFGVRRTARKRTKETRYDISRIYRADDGRQIFAGGDGDHRVHAAVRARGAADHGGDQRALSFRRRTQRAGVRAHRQACGRELCSFSANLHRFRKNITFGKRVFVNSGCCFQDQGGIAIGDGTLIGHQVVFATLDHMLDPADRASMIAHPITVGKNVWIGSHATILSGVTIGDNSVVAAVPSSPSPSPQTPSSQASPHASSRPSKNDIL